MTGIEERGRWWRGSRVLPLLASTAVGAVGLLAARSHAHAQPAPERTTVVGTVVNARTGVAIAASALLLLPDAEGKQSSQTLPVPHLSGVAADPRGRLVMRDVPEGQYYLVVSATGFHPFSKLISVAPPGMEAGTISLTPYDTLVWRILKPDGTVVANTQVYAALRIGGSAPRNEAWTTDANGEYPVSFSAAAAHSVFIRLPGVGGGYGEVKTKLGEEARGEVSLRPGGVITGTIVEAAGTPLANRVLSVTPHGKPPETVPIPPYPPLSAKADAKGVFSVAEVPAGSWQVIVGGDDVLSSAPALAKVEEGKASAAGAVKVALAPVVNGLLIGVAGDPLATLSGATLVMEVAKGSGEPVVLSAAISPAAAGRFTAFAQRLGKTRFAVSVSGEGYAVSPVVEVDAGKAVDVELRLQPFAAVRGTAVRAPGGKPVPGAQVTLKPAAGSGTMGFRPLTTTTDNRGLFVLGELMPGSYELSATATDPAAAGTATVQVDPAGGDPVVVELKSAPGDGGAK